MRTAENQWPSFLDLLDSDPKEVCARFHEYLRCFLATTPPGNITMVPRDRREDLLGEINLHCIERDFHKLRQYRKMDKPFSHWFSIVVRREIAQFGQDTWEKVVVDGTNKNDPDGPDRVTVEPDPAPPTDEQLHRRILIEAVHECLRTATMPCRKLLLASAEELLPREMGAFLGEPEISAKKLSDDLRYCRKKLLKCLSLHGIDIETDCRGDKIL